jgi:tetratricopeptide (TPR) repeat protein
MLMSISAAIVSILLLASYGSVQSGQHDHSAQEKLGTVRFANSCSEAAQPAFARAMALLHSFEFAPAIGGFTAAAKTDPGCAIAYWGMAVSRWGNPFAAGIKPAAQLEQGRAAIDKAKSIGAKTPREKDFIAAAERLFTDFATIDQRTRLLAYRDAMAQVAARYKDDVEAAAFYALALAASTDPADRTYTGLLEAGAILERLARAHPDHPGLAHYVIHAYDVPALAPRAVESAKQYAMIAPSAPHALHMPSHTFTRLGYWQQSIDSNIASADAARREKLAGEELHAMDYQAYAYLQTAQDAAARKLVDALPEVAGRFDPDQIGGAAPGTAGLFALAAIPARYALERRAWSEAARLELRPSRFAPADAMTLFARALGAASTGDVATARTAVDGLQQLRDRLAQAKEAYWSEQVEIQRLGATAWIALKEGRTDEAIATMRTAVDREDATEKNAMTPGPIAPARELLGDMLLQVKKPADALAAYETTLKKEPNRYRALAGAAEAARLAGDAAKSRTYSRQLLAVAARADGPARPELAAAKEGAR